jgi:mutator protein MutT
MADMIRVTAAVIERDGRVLIARRRAEDRFGGRWEFPGGKLEPGETPEEGLRREHDDVRWAAPADLPGYEFAEADRPIVRILTEEAARARS